MAWHCVDCGVATSSTHSDEECMTNLRTRVATLERERDEAVETVRKWKALGVDWDAVVRARGELDSLRTQLRAAEALAEAVCELLSVQPKELSHIHFEVLDERLAAFTRAKGK